MPPKKSKQTPKNGFYYFMLDFKAKQGKNFNSMKDVADAAGPHWSRMSKDQRRPFDEKALMERNHVRPGKYTSDGLDVDELERQEREEQAKVDRMKENIYRDLNMATTEQLQDKVFFIIHINVFCYCSTENRHYPAEIGIAKFSLQDGVTSVFHHLIKPGLLPLGYAGEASLRSKETHQIAPPMADNTENNVEDVFIEMKQFLQSEVRSQRMPILYSDQKYVKMIELILNTWCSDYEDDRSIFTVYDLQYFFRTLKNTAVGENVWTSDTFSAREIEKDVYAYAVGIACDYHEITSSVWCSKSIVTRYAYIICDVCCQDLGIELIPGAHIPDKAFKVAGSSRPSSVASSTSTRSRLRDINSSIREDDSVSLISMSSRSEWDNQSVTSEASTITGNEDKNFPSLERGVKHQMSSPHSWNRFTPNDSSSVFSQSSMKSYAGATGTSGLSRRPADMPSSVKNSMEMLGSGDSVKSSDVFSFGRGKPRDFDNGNDFPALGGRSKNTSVPKGRGVRRPFNGP